MLPPGADDIEKTTESDTFKRRLSRIQSGTLNAALQGIIHEEQEANSPETLPGFKRSLSGSPTMPDGTSSEDEAGGLPVFIPTDSEDDEVSVI